MNDAPRGWWSSNWKWALPSGCLLVVVLLFGGCMAFVVHLAGMVKDNVAFTTAFERLRSSPDAIAVLGEPIETGWGFSGGFNDHGDSGDAHYSQSVGGPRGQGTLYVEAIKDEGRWRYRVLKLVPEGDHDSIDLRTPAEIEEFGDTVYEHGRDGLDGFDDSFERDPVEPDSGERGDDGRDDRETDDADADDGADDNADAKPIKTADTSGAKS